MPYRRTLEEVGAAIDVVFFGLNPTFTYNRFVSPTEVGGLTFDDIPGAQAVRYVNVLEKCLTCPSLTNAQFDQMKDDSVLSTLTIPDAGETVGFSNKQVPRLVLFQTQTGRRGILQITQFVGAGEDSYIITFFYQLIKPAIRRPHRYKRLVVGYCVVCAGLLGAFFLPPTYFNPIKYGITLSMVSLSNLNIAWLFGWAVLAYFRARIWSPLAICLLGLTPLVLSQLVTLIRTIGEQDTYRQAPPSPLYILLVLSYITFDQFRKELVTRQRMQAQVRAAADQNDALRRQEIEGIGRDLHDQVGNTLATALSYLSRSPLNPDTLRNILLSAIGELRFLSHNLVRDDDRPLTHKVESLVSRFNDFATVRLTYADYSQGRINALPPLTQQNLYRILQELLTNVIRHSAATQATVQFFREGNTVDISVEDDGVGFDPAANHTKGIGIQTIYKRAALVGLTVRFDSTPTGTTVLLQTLLSDPLPHPNDAH